MAGAVREMRRLGQGRLLFGSYPALALGHTLCQAGQPQGWLQAAGAALPSDPSDAKGWGPCRLFTYKKEKRKKKKLNLLF